MERILLLGNDKEFTENFCRHIKKRYILVERDLIRINGCEDRDCIAVFDNVCNVDFTFDFIVCCGKTLPDREIGKIVHENTLLFFERENKELDVGKLPPLCKCVSVGTCERSTVAVTSITREALTFFVQRNIFYGENEIGVGEFKVNIGIYDDKNMLAVVSASIISMFSDRPPYVD